jgi:hypothetical protein
MKRLAPICEGKQEIIIIIIVCESRGIGSEKYIEILSEGLLSFVDDLLGSEEETAVRVRQLSDITFMHDGAACHRDAEATSFLAEEEFKVMSWSAQSPDLNPIENIWHILGVKFHEHFTDIRCSLSKSQSAIEKYGDILRVVWGEINGDIVGNLVRSMPGRVQAVIEANGGATGY